MQASSHYKSARLCGGPDRGGPLGALHIETRRWVPVERGEE
jgi:hypothetical protein